ncbi:hypothetical protein AB0I28_31840 [Phytomonospora sp. NPDC050363]|uniref:hypothetical protein n=1 Tax=Phytomonospora sp. NPDC050363 TaxID=3155642 RepID=UPI0033D7B364
MGSIILPVGKSLGPTYNDEGVLEYTELHLGNTTEELDAGQIAVWELAHSDADAHNEHRFTLDHLRELAAGTVEDADTAIEGLFKLGALVRVDLELDELQPLLGRHRLIPTGHAFGNTAETPDWYGIGRNEDVDINLGATGYFLWATSYRDASMWASCAEFTRDLPEVDVDDVAGEFANALPIIIAADCGYLETAP